MSFHGGFSQWTWQQAVNYTQTTYLHHHQQQYSDNIDPQQTRRDGYNLQAKNQELKQTISVLLCEKHKYREDLKASEQAYQLAQHVSYIAQSNSETQKHYFHSAEVAYNKAQEQTRRYSNLLTDAWVKTRALEVQLRFRGYTTNHLNAMLEDKQAMIDEYWRRMGQRDNMCWAADTCAWRYNLVEEGENLGEILFRISRAADEMECLFRGYRKGLTDRMDVVSEGGDGGDAMWRAAPRAAAGNVDLASLERDLDALINGVWPACGLGSVRERNFSSITTEAQASGTVNGTNAQMQEESESEYEPPETIHQPSTPGKMFASSTQPLQVTVVGRNNWFHMYGTGTQDVFMFNGPQDPVGQPIDLHAFIQDVELTQASQETFDCGMFCALPTQDPQRIRISPSLQVAGYQAMQNATPAEEPSIASMRYKSSRLYMNAKGELVQIRDPATDVKQEISPVMEQSSSQESDMERQNLQSTSSSRVGAKWWLVLLCFVFLWYMRPSGETDRQKLLETNQAPKDLRTRIQRNRDSEFAFMQMLAYEMSKRSNIDPMALG
ncbi:hypothetical protein CA14_001483 [Aspergillus flavus]|uniref:Uncharacterized protein n=1 Tax=Aspergillus flavus TaxID=5059 RepID=A0AB74C3J8_ASPFL|nr:hypothetical protein CA14_001483 [Aspergillus flavus]